MIISSTRCAKNGYELWKLANAGKSKLKLGFDKRKEENEKTKRSAKPKEAADRFSIRKIKKWSNRPVSNWATVRNQLALDDKIQARILKYEND